MSRIELYIKDLGSRDHPVRKYGTDRHDSLVISEDGRTLSYYNLQNGDGSEYGDYRFCDADGLIPEEDEDLQIYGAEAYANIGGFGMTKEEAKNILQGAIKKPNTKDGYLGQAIDMAVKALEQPISDDCVSRAEAIEWIENLRQMDKCFGNCEDDYFPLSEVIDRLKNVPPVTPTFPKGATNGDVITAMFPNIEANEIITNTGGYIEVKYLDTTDVCDATAFRKNWWNALYTEKRGNEDGSN